jgi:hypothetical protein
LAVALALGPRGRPARVVAVGLAVWVLLAPAVALRSPPAEWRADGVSVYRAGGATVVSARAARPIDALEALRTAGVRRIDVLVVEGRGGAEVARVLRHRWTVGRVVDAVAGPAVRLRLGGLDVAVQPPAPPEVRVRSP